LEEIQEGGIENEFPENVEIVAGDHDLLKLALVQLAFPDFVGMKHNGHQPVIDLQIRQKALALDPGLNVQSAPLAPSQTPRGIEKGEKCFRAPDPIPWAREAGQRIKPAGRGPISINGTTLFRDKRTISEAFLLHGKVNNGKPGPRIDAVAGVSLQKRVRVKPKRRFETEHVVGGKRKELVFAARVETR
jgi:hypothetical protein